MKRFEYKVVNLSFKNEEKALTSWAMKAGSLYAHIVLGFTLY